MLCSALRPAFALAILMQHEVQSLASQAHVPAPFTCSLPSCQPVRSQVKHLSAAQSVLRHKEPARLGAAKEAAAALSAVEAATGRLETSLSDV